MSHSAVAAAGFLALLGVVAADPYLRLLPQPSATATLGPSLPPHAAASAEPPPYVTPQPSLDEFPDASVVASPIDATGPPPSPTAVPPARRLPNRSFPPAPPFTPLLVANVSWRAVAPYVPTLPLDIDSAILFARRAVGPGCPDSFAADLTAHGLAFSGDDVYAPGWEAYRIGEADIAQVAAPGVEAEISAAWLRRVPVDDYVVTVNVTVYGPFGDVLQTAAVQTTAVRKATSAPCTAYDDAVIARLRALSDLERRNSGKLFELYLDTTDHDGLPYSPDPSFDGDISAHSTTPEPWLIPPPSVSKPLPSGVEALPSDAKPVPSDAEPVPSDLEPLPSDMESLPPYEDPTNPLPFPPADGELRLHVAIYWVTDSNEIDSAVRLANYTAGGNCSPPIESPDPSPPIVLFSGNDKQFFGLEKYTVVLSRAQRLGVWKSLVDIDVFAQWIPTRNAFRFVQPMVGIAVQLVERDGSVLGADSVFVDARWLFEPFGCTDHKVARVRIVEDAERSDTVAFELAAY